VHAHHSHLPTGLLAQQQLQPQPVVLQLAQGVPSQQQVAAQQAANRQRLAMMQQQLNLQGGRR
jgi:hypothetical protein